MNARIRKSLPVVLTAILVTGCASSTVIGGGKDNPHGNLHVWVSVVGPKGKPYYSVSNKEVYVSVPPGTLTPTAGYPEGVSPVALCARRFDYSNVGDLCWSAVWRGEREVVVEFYDFGALSRYDQHLQPQLKRFVATVTIVDRDGHWSCQQQATIQQAPGSSQQLTSDNDDKQPC